VALFACRSVEARIDDAEDTVSISDLARPTPPQSSWVGRRVSLFFGWKSGTWTNRHREQTRLGVPARVPRRPVQLRKAKAGRSSSYAETEHSPQPCAN